MEELTDEIVAAKWHEIGPLIDRLNERTETPGEFDVSWGSSLAGDDRASSPYQVSHALRSCLMSGIDHLHACKVLLLEARVLHVSAPATLLRGCLENMATAYWILGPDARDDRIERALRWYAKNAQDQERAVKDLALDGYKTVEEILAKIESVADKRPKIDVRRVRRGYTSTEAVRYADQLGSSNLGVLLPWQLCSGFAHGRPWAHLAWSVREEFAAHEAGVVRLRLTNDFNRVIYPALAAMHLLEDFLRLYARRSGSLSP